LDLSIILTRLLFRNLILHFTFFSSLYNLLYACSLAIRVYSCLQSFVNCLSSGLELVRSAWRDEEYIQAPACRSSSLNKINIVKILLLSSHVLSASLVRSWVAIWTFLNCRFALLDVRHHKVNVCFSHCSRLLHIPHITFEATHRFGIYYLTLSNKCPNSLRCRVVEKQSADALFWNLLQYFCTTIFVWNILAHFMFWAFRQYWMSSIVKSNGTSYSWS